jgi:signal peptidase I
VFDEYSINHSSIRSNVPRAVEDQAPPPPLLPTVSRPRFGYLLGIVETLVLTLVIFLVIQSFVAQPYQVQQRSMEHTLEPAQYVLVDKLTARFDGYKRGDIVVFNPPSAWGQSDGTPFIKRVIGVGGDTIEIKDDRVYSICNRPGRRVTDRPGWCPWATSF